MLPVLLVGESPLPDKKGFIRTAAALRTWHFLTPLRKKNIPLVLLTIDAEQKAKRSIKKVYSKTYTHISIPKREGRAIKTIRKLMKEQEFRAIVGINNYPAYLVAQSHPRIPFWADLNGWVMAEAQAQAGVTNNDSFIPFLWKREKTILKYCDKISTVSTPQKYAIYGELATMGRLNSETNGYEFIDVIPNATEKFPSDTVTPNHVLFRGKKVPRDAFVVAHIGGYNTWVDEVTLFKAIRSAVRKNPKIHFVSTGGAIQGLNNKTFQNFLRLIENSPIEDHFHFLGWLKTKDMPHVYTESDCGINVDKLCTETYTGARNRLNEMLKFDLPVITTAGSEIADELRQHHAAIVCKSGNYKPLTDAILKLADPENKDIEIDLVKHGKSFLRKYSSYSSTTKPLVEWLTNPEHAANKIVNVNKRSTLKASFLYLRQKGVKGLLKRVFR